MAKILIIDDSRFARLKMSDKLKEGGFEVIEAENGEIGLKVTQRENPDCIICDLLMPVMGGFDFLTNAKQEGIDIPVLILTSDIQEKTRSKAMELGALELINKPPNYGEIISRINKTLRDRKC
ncbi:MAG: response regulator [bacterium]|nr:response regulator [bacterium]